MNKIKTILKEHYNLDAIDISQQRGGWTALAYKVCDSTHTYFLKVFEKRRTSISKWTALIDVYVPIIIWLTNQSHLKGKMPVQLLTKEGHYKYEDDECIYLLHEYIEGKTIGDKDLDEHQVHQLAEIISALHLHGGEIPFETEAIQEDFEVPFLEQLRTTLNNNDLPEDIKESLSPYMKKMNDLMDTIEKLSSRLKKSHLRLALCHTDLHNWNLMQSGEQLILLDWEGLRLAPVEADMMFLVDKPYYDDFLNVYQKDHKDFAINLDALTFYKGSRDLDDIWVTLEQLLFDNQDAQERAITMKRLTTGLEGIS